jgi:hypothetical protein
MSNKPLPSLSPSGWIHDVAKKADLLLSYFLVSEPAQSETYKITTLQYILAKPGTVICLDDTDYGDDLISLIKQLLGIIITQFLLIQLI